MKRKGAEGLAGFYWMSPATNEEFTGMVNGLARLARPQSGWDPYEVWRTRVKGFLHCDAGAQTRRVTRAAGLERSAYAEALFLEKQGAQWAGRGRRYLGGRFRMWRSAVRQGTAPTPGAGAD
jgi:hypothetical protein